MGGFHCAGNNPHMHPWMGGGWWMVGWMDSSWMELGGLLSQTNARVLDPAIGLTLGFGPPGQPASKVARCHHHPPPPSSSSSPPFQSFSVPFSAWLPTGRYTFSSHLTHLQIYVQPTWAIVHRYKPRTGPEPTTTHSYNTHRQWQ